MECADSSQEPVGLNPGPLSVEQVVEDLEAHIRVGRGMERQRRVLQDAVRIVCASVLKLSCNVPATPGRRVVYRQWSSLWGEPLCGRSGGRTSAERERIANLQDAVVDDGLTAICVAADAA